MGLECFAEAVGSLQGRALLVLLLRALRLKGNIPAGELLMGLTLFAATSLSILFTRVPGGIALFWPGSAIAAAWLIRFEKVRWLAATTAVLSAFFLSNALVAHRPWATAADFTAVNVLEISATVLAFSPRLAISLSPNLH